LAAANFNSSSNKVSIWVDLRGLIHDLSSDGVLSQEDANLVAGTPRPSDKSHWHPLQILAEFGFTNQKNQNQILDLANLNKWYAEKSGQPLYNIDPLKIDVPAVTEVMSYAFA